MRRKLGPEVVAVVVDEQLFLNLEQKVVLDLQEK
jgi:hypothetical protein